MLGNVPRTWYGMLVEPAAGLLPKTGDRNAGALPAPGLTAVDEVKDLAARASRGEGEAQEALIRRFEESIYRLAYRILGDGELAEDARQETFIRMLQSIRRFEVERRFSTWLFSIATHVALDMARHRQASRELPAPRKEPAEEPLEVVIREEDHAFLNEALDALAPETRALLALRFQDGLSPAQISRILGDSPNQVRVDLWRARLALRSLLQRRAAESLETRGDRES